VSGSALLAVMPALPLHQAGKYVAAAYIVAFLIVLVYVAIMAIRLSRVERELGELVELAQNRTPAPASTAADASESQLDASHSQPVGAPAE
jgi:CcmD family protein